MNLFFAQAAAAAPAGGGAVFTQLLILVPLFGIMYFLMIRPQKKRQQEIQEMQKTLKVGDKVLMNSGAIGVISKVLEKNIHVNFADKIDIEFVRSAVSGVLKDDEETENKAK